MQKFKLSRYLRMSDDIFKYYLSDVKKSKNKIYYGNYR